MGEVKECRSCGVQRLENYNGDIYDSGEYREIIGEHRWDYAEHDLVQKQHFDLIDEPLRGKKVLEVGSGGGSFADMLRGICQVSTVEPNVKYKADYRSVAEARGSYDYIFAWDVIEHVDNPLEFWQDCYKLLKGVMFTSTPNSDDFLMTLPEYREFFYRTVHKWYFDRHSLVSLADMANLNINSITCFHRFGISNAFGWFDEKKPYGRGRMPFTNSHIDEIWKSYLESSFLGDNLLICTSRR